MKSHLWNSNSHLQTIKRVFLVWEAFLFGFFWLVWGGGGGLLFGWFFFRNKDKHILQFLRRFPHEMNACIIFAFLLLTLCSSVQD